MTKPASTEFSVLTFKSARGGDIKHTGLSWADALVKADSEYEDTKKLAAEGSLPPGVAVLVTEDGDAPALANSVGIPRDKAGVILYQCGGY